jgi:hypothetical protein
MTGSIVTVDGGCTATFRQARKKPEGAAPGRPLALRRPVKAGRRFSSFYPAKRARAGTNEAAFTVPHPVASL